MKITLALIALIVAATATPALADPHIPQPVNVSLLRQWTPKTSAQMDAADPVALAYLAKGWLIVGDRKRARVILNAVARRGEMAYTAGSLPSLAGNGFNPVSTVYTIALVQVMDAYRAAGRTSDVNHAVAALERIPLTNNGGCYAYSIPDAPAGCIQDIGGITLGVVSRIPGFDYSKLLAYEQATQLANGSWWFWQDNHAVGIEDAAHLAWTAFMLLSSPDPAVRSLGMRAARFVSATYDPATAPGFAVYAVAAVRLEAGLVGGCELAAKLPAWADSYRQVDPDGSVSIKNQQWAAYVYTLAGTVCPLG